MSFPALKIARNNLATAIGNLEDRRLEENSTLPKNRHDSEWYKYRIIEGEEDVAKYERIVKRLEVTGQVIGAV